MDINNTKIEDDKHDVRTIDSGSHHNNFKELYQDLYQQLECEKKLNFSMTDALENKVSELIAENDTLKISNIKLTKKHQEYDEDIAELKERLQNMSKVLED